MKHQFFVLFCVCFFWGGGERGRGEVISRYHFITISWVTHNVNISSRYSTTGQWHRGMCILMIMVNFKLEDNGARYLLK
jgi:hypothetical protein